MDRYLVFERHDSQHSSLKLLYLSPEPVAVSLLRFASQWILENSNASFFLEVRTFLQHFLLEVVGKLVRGHPSHNRAFT